ncbi:MAG: polysaccharide biosynthesis protein, partial [Actinomycetota bacterium]|nr:polysaccharide biosynthesis protein [Actinomycetota bacterium]
MQSAYLSRVVNPSADRERWIAWDGIVWFLAVAASALMIDNPSVRSMIEVAAVAVVLNVASGLIVTRFRGRDIVGSVDDAVRVASLAGVVGLLSVSFVVSGLLVAPLAFPIITTLVALPLLLAPRLAVRLITERRHRPDTASAARAIVFGAGWGGQQTVRTMLNDPESTYRPVAVLDDDPRVRSRRIAGVPVRGTRADLADVARATSASVLVVAIRTLDAETVREINIAASRAGLGVLVIPAMQDMLRPWIELADLKNIDVTDLLGRSPVDVDVSEIAGYLSGRTVLVTGAGGSIGSELCRQVRRYRPEALLMLDRDESALHALQLSLDGRALLDSPEVILADIREYPTIERIFAERRPDVVFHAAALKHLPMLEQYPHEAWLTNVAGTANVVNAALASGVDIFVNVSTDKAANPTSVLGYSKRIGERLVAAAAEQRPAQ